MKIRFILCLLVASPMWLIGQITYLDLLPRHPDSLGKANVQQLDLFLQIKNGGPLFEDSALHLGSFSWDEKKRFEQAAILMINREEIDTKDSVSFEFFQDTVVKSEFRSYPMREDELEYGMYDPDGIPPFDPPYLNGKLTMVYEDGILVKQYTKRDTTYFTYNEHGHLVQQKTFNTERDAMDLGGYTWKTYSYDGDGNILTKYRVDEGPRKTRDTMGIHVYNYMNGQLNYVVEPSGIVPGVSNITMYRWENGELYHKEKRMTMMVSTGPPTYDRREKNILFEWEFEYKDGKLTDEKLFRDGELEEWTQFEYGQEGLLSVKREMDVYAKEPYKTWKYRYTFQAN
ncbi:MAG: hypothetical protein AAGI38_19770 [Bacteroidota bacterium]